MARNDVKYTRNDVKYTRNDRRHPEAEGREDLYILCCV